MKLGEAIAMWGVDCVPVRDVFRLWRYEKEQKADRYGFLRRTLGCCILCGRLFYQNKNGDVFDNPCECPNEFSWGEGMEAEQTWVELVASPVFDSYIRLFQILEMAA